jgi:hypothetical protein
MFDFRLRNIADDDEGVALRIQVLFGDALNIFFRNSFDPFRIL